MNCHFSADKKAMYNRTWAPIMTLIANDMRERGYTLTKDANLMWWQEPANVIPCTPNEDDLVIYTDRSHDHTHGDNSLYVGLQGPEAGHFSIDKVGVWPHLEQTYTKPPVSEVIETNFYFNEAITLYKENKVNHYNNRHLQKASDIEQIPDDHILICVSNIVDTAWNHAWHRFGSCINHIILNSKFPVVVKFDPQLVMSPKGEVDESRLAGITDMLNSMDTQRVTYFTGLESLHDILPKTRVTILDENVINLEPYMYNKPILTYGAPPSRHYIKQIYHQHELIPLIEDLSWFPKDRHWSEDQKPRPYDWLQWYMSHYLCSDKITVNKRLNQLL